MRERLNGMRLLALLLTLASFGGAASTAQAARGIPEGMIGLDPQTALDQAELNRMARSHVWTIRAPFIWYTLAPQPPWRQAPDWSAVDTLIERAANEGIRVIPFLYGTPGWLADDTRIEPVNTARARRAWSAFLRSAVERYSPGGIFWQTHPWVPRYPIRIWQIWNEPNIASFSLHPSPRRYARLVRISARAIHSAAPNAQILLAGLFGHALQTPPNFQPDDFLRQALRGTGVAQIADAVALHPYVPYARQIPPKIEALRRVLRDFGVPRMPLWITEMGWGSDPNESRWERGWMGQARQLNIAMRLLAQSHRRWHVRKIFWYSWVDAPICQFCDSAGLFTADGQAKPSWYAFNSWTGGDPALP
jgi:hypothetical protein